MAKKTLWLLFILLALIIGLYPALYFILDRKFALLQSKSDVLLSNIFWNTAFYSHIIPGGISLLVGWSLFSKKMRTTNIQLHRKIGKIYVYSVLISSLAGIYIGFFATGGLWVSLGFISLALVWFGTTLMSFVYVRKGMINLHEKLMIYSYAACAAAITLRIWLPLLNWLLKDFTTAYMITSWICWIPNLFIAFLITRNQYKK